jgi:nucleoside-diphosphate-sugar epimerase
VKRFVHCSTVGVQGEIEHPPATEEAPVRPGDHYQESKLEGERLALKIHREKGFPVVVFRPVGIYGPGDTRFLKMFRMVLNKAPILGSGDVLYHLTFIDDLVEGIRLVGETPGIAGEVFTLAGPRYTTLNELFRIIADVLGVRPPSLHLPVWPVWAAGAVCEALCRPLRIQPPIYRRRVDFFLKNRAFDISKARRVLGYNPRVDLREGLARTADWYRMQGLLR